VSAKGGVPLLVLHDFDKAGFSILGTFRRNTRRFSFKNKVNVIDLGLRLVDVRAHDLQVEDVHYRGNPRPNLRENGATKEEVDFLCVPGTYEGQRVELNAFASADLIDWLEAKLKKHGVKKIIPQAKVSKAAYRRSRQARLFKERSAKLAKRCRVEVKKAQLPEDLAAKVAEMLESNPAQAWDDVIAGMATV
jgi:hypothetical protein